MLLLMLLLLLPLLLPLKMLKMLPHFCVAEGAIHLVDKERVVASHSSAMETLTLYYERDLSLKSEILKW